MSASPKPVEERTDKGLERYVGYAEILAAIPVSKSTIERAWRGPHRDGEPRLPKPGKVRGRAVWPAMTVNRWARQIFDRQLSDLERLAQSDPDKLASEKLEAAAFDLAARHLSRAEGQDVTPERVVLGFERPMTEGERTACVARLAAEFANPPFAGYEFERAVLMAAHLFPTLREFWKAKPGMPQTADQARYWALMAADDEAWSKFRSEAANPGR